MNEADQLLTTPTEARRYLWSWFAFVLLGSGTFLVFVFSEPPVYLFPAVPTFGAGVSLYGLAKRAAARSRPPDHGPWAAQLWAGDVYNSLVGQEGFNQAASLLSLPRRRWQALRWIALGILILSLGIVALRILVFQSAS